MKYYISDTHFGHKKLIQMSPSLQRYGQSYDILERNIIEAWNNKVKLGDLVYHLGDFMFYKDLDNALRLIDALNGQIYFILGNHDDSKIFYNNKLLKKVAKVTREATKIKDGDNTIILHHYPMWDWQSMWRGSYHFYGHIHEENRYPRPKSYYVGMESIGIAPLSFEEIIKGELK